MSYQPMEDDELLAFLLARPARPAVLATTRPDGRPHAAPVWYDLDGPDLVRGALVFNTGADTVKGRNMALRPEVTLVVQDDRAPFSFAVLSGTATLVDDLEQVRSWAGRIGGRYMGEDQAEAYGDRNGVVGELLVRVAVTHVVTARDVAG